MTKPPISDIIEGSYKEGHELQWKRSYSFAWEGCYQSFNDTVFIEQSSIRGDWKHFFNSIECNIARDMKKYYPEIVVRWI